MIRKIIFLAFCIALLAGNIVAQKDNSSYMSANIYTGLSSLNYGVTGIDGHDGNAKSKIGIGFSAKYDYYFNRHWGIGTGLGLSIYNGSAIIRGGMGENNIYRLGSYIDDDNSGLPRNFELRGRMENIKEKQNVQLFEIPLTLLYQTRFSYGKWGAYGSLGIKFQAPMSKKYEVVKNAGSSINVSGYYTDATQGFDLGAPGNPSVEQHGFGTLDNPGPSLGWKGSSELKSGIAGTLEAGAISRLTNESDFCFGIYIDYGFSDIKKESGSLLSGPANAYHPEANDNVGRGIIYNGLFNSNHTDKIKPVSFGIKIGVRFKL